MDELDSPENNKLILFWWWVVIQKKGVLRGSEKDNPILTTWWSSILFLIVFLLHGCLWNCGCWSRSSIVFLRYNDFHNLPMSHKSMRLHNTLLQEKTWTFTQFQFIHLNHSCSTWWSQHKSHHHTTLIYPHSSFTQIISCNYCPNNIVPTIVCLNGNNWIRHKTYIWEGIHTMMCSSFLRTTIKVWMIFQSVCFHIDLHTSNV